MEKRAGRSIRSRRLREFASRREIGELEARPGHQWLPLERIARRDEKRLDERKVVAIVEHLRRGGLCKPIVVARMDDRFYRIVGDGRHRYVAHQRAGIPLIFCRLVN